MKRTLSLWLGLAAAALLALALAPAQAPQAPAGTTGKIHGKVINPTGQPQGGGTVSLSTDGGVTLKYTFPVDDSGNYTGEAPAGNLHGGLPRGRYAGRQDGRFHPRRQNRRRGGYGTGCRHVAPGIHRQDDAGREEAAGGFEEDQCRGPARPTSSSTSSTPI